MKHEGKIYTNRDECIWYCHQRIIKGRKMNGNRPNNNINENGQKTEKSPGDVWTSCCHSNSSERPSAKTDKKNNAQPSTCHRKITRINSNGTLTYKRIT